MTFDDVECLFYSKHACNVFLADLGENYRYGEHFQYDTEGRVIRLRQLSKMQMLAQRSKHFYIVFTR